MKIKQIPSLLAIMASFLIYAQTPETFNYEKLMQNEASKKHPYGKPNEKVLPELKDYDKLIGVCNCKSVQYRNGIAGDTLQLKWRWKYILNGNGVQDDGWFGNDSIQSSFTSIRILNPQTKKWHVPFFTPNMRANPQIWIGGKEGDNIVLKRTQKTQNGGEAESILTFSNITDKGFNWEGKIYIPTKNFTNVFWRIWCIKEK